VLTAFCLVAMLDSPVIAQWFSYVARERFDFTVRQDDAEGLPPWNELIEDPPLPPRRAILLAQSQLEKLVSDADKWTFAGLRLQPLKVKDAWVYVIDFHGPLPPGVIDGSSPLMSIVVLMNGSAIQPTRSPWSPK